MLLTRMVYNQQKKKEKKKERTNEKATELTADCTIEQTMSNTERIVVDCGTHAGIQVPVGECFNMLLYRDTSTEAKKNFSSQAECSALKKKIHRPFFVDMARPKQASAR
jgi:hypothetical protein